MSDEFSLISIEMAKKISLRLNKLSFSPKTKFALMAALMMVLVVGASVYLLTFLISKLNIALNNDQRPAPVVNFDVDDFEALNLIKR